MTRGTFANVRIKNLMVPGVEGGVTKFFGTRPIAGEEMSILRCRDEIQGGGNTAGHSAGQEYGTGSSRDWAAKGTLLLGVQAVVAASFERIHRSNLVEWASCRCNSWRERRANAWSGWLRDVFSHRSFRLHSTGTGAESRNQGTRRRLAKSPGETANRYADRSRLLSARRNSSVCPRQLLATNK